MSTEKISQPPTSSQIILVVDDEELARKSIRMILEHSGYSRVLDASNGIEALKLVEALDEIIDLIITDVQMPGMDGIALVRAIKERHPHIPVVYVSGYPQPDAVNTSEPYCEFVQKPFLPKTLVAAVRKCIKKPETESVSAN